MIKALYYRQLSRHHTQMAQKAEQLHTRRMHLDAAEKFNRLAREAEGRPEA